MSFTSSNLRERRKSCSKSNFRVLPRVDPAVQREHHDLLETNDRTTKEVYEFYLLGHTFDYGFLAWSTTSSPRAELDAVLFDFSNTYTRRFPSRMNVQEHKSGGEHRILKEPRSYI